MPVCEGCGARTDEAHIQRRAQRLELAAKFRPISIKVLFLEGAPPARLEDYFYRAATDRSVRSVAARSYFDELAKCVSATGSGGEEQALREFQRQRFFLTYAVECPFEEHADPQATLRRFAPTAVKHVQTDCIPSYIVPLSGSTRELVRLFGLVGWGDRLILDKGGPFEDPYLGDPQKQAALGTGYGERIRQLLAALP
ncbi:MAG TPA: hypothetical protein VMH00_15995 [Candidatus Limnocylindrales bacterium]|nr:hypothetical protein [Candidatus Limnocylindrales bacterium]